MKTSSFRPLVAAATALLSSLGCSGVEHTRPNVILFVVDDLGWVDMGVYGSPFYETPRIDRLASQGARFTQFYAASPVCSPTRASLMTGKDPARLNLTNWIGGEQRGRLLQAAYVRELRLEEFTIGEAFHEAGYATGFIGKWHLGSEPYYPEHQGFDVNIGGHAAGQPGSYFFPYENERLPWSNVPDLEDGEEGEYLTDRLTDEALSFIEANRNGPFFLVLSHYSVHTPLQSKADLEMKYENKAASMSETERPNFVMEGTTATTRTTQGHSVYAGMIESTDESVGRLMDKLYDLQISDNTIVVFVSDNGGLSTLAGRRTSMPTANVPLRAGKGWLYEGGIRVPLIVRWPGGGMHGRTIDQPAVTTDLYPTLLEMAGLNTNPQQHRDGVSLVPLLRGVGDFDRGPIFWHFPHYHGSGNVPSGAVRVGSYKLIEWLEDGRIELYDLDLDMSESTDLVTQMPEKAAGLLELLQEWRQSVDAGMPRPNPDWEEVGVAQPKNGSGQ
jgi:arylsulfatase A-like enzyme